SWRESPASRSTICLRRTGESRPTMPKSISAMRLPGRYITLPGCGIGVEEAVHQDHLKHGIRAARSERLSVDARIVDCCQVVAADTLDALLHIHHAAGPLPIDARDEDIEIVGKVARKAFHVACLHREIKLALERAAQLAYDLDRPVATHFGYLALYEMGKAL